MKYYLIKHEGDTWISAIVPNQESAKWMEDNLGVNAVTRWEYMVFKLHWTVNTVLKWFGLRG